MNAAVPHYLRGTVTWQARRQPKAVPLRAAARSRIAYFMNLFPNLTETFVYREVESLRARGVDVMTFSIRRPDPDSVSAEARRHLEDTHYILPLPLGQLILSHVRAFCRRPLRYLRLAWETISGTHERQRDRLRSLCQFVEAIAIIDDIRASGATHLHAHFAVGSATCVWVLARYLDLPFSFTAHAYDIWLDRLLLPEKLRDANFVVTCTDENRRYLASTYAASQPQLIVVHHGVDAQRFYAGERSQRSAPLILSVGRLCEQKGFDVLLHACALLKQWGTPFECHIVGDGELADDLRALAVKLDVESEVRFLGRAFQEDLPKLYADADVFALACKRAANNDRDGIPNTLMEAMASSLPVVSTRFSGIPELVTEDENGLLAPSEDPVALAQALQRLLADRELRERLGAAGRARVVRELTLERAAEVLNGLFDREIEHGAARNDRGVHVLTWDPVCRRSDDIARQLQVPLETIHYFGYRRPWIAPLKYPLQALMTLISLARRRPRVVMVSNPPPFTALTAWLHCLVSDCALVIDAHTGVFLEPKWRPFLPLNRFLMRRAALTLVTNEELRQRVECWGGRGFILPDPLPEAPLPTGAYPLDSSRFNIAAVFSFYEDEPIEEMLSLRDLPDDVQIHITGDYRGVPQRWRDEMSPQLTLCGFMPRPQYDDLLARCDAVIVLCTRPHTLLCGAYEAVAAGKPVITSESEAMRHYFRAGTVFVENSCEGIAAGVRTVRARHAELSAEVVDLDQQLRREWQQTFSRCRETYEGHAEKLRTEPGPVANL